MVELKDEIVPLTAEDIKEIHSQMKLQRGCSYFFIVVAVLIIGYIVLFALLNSRPVFGFDATVTTIITLVVTSIILLISYVMSRHHKKLIKANIKRILITPVEKLFIGENYRRQRNEYASKTYYVKVNGDETSYPVKKEFYEQLKEGDIVEVHVIPETDPQEGFGTTRVVLRDIVKVSDTPQ
jgi:hypothetical protein